MKIKTNIRAGIAYPPPVSRCRGIGPGPIPPGGGGGGGGGTIGDNNAI